MAEYDVTITVAGEAKTGKSTIALAIQRMLTAYGAKVTFADVDEYNEAHSFEADRIKNTINGKNVLVKTIIKTVTATRIL